jgi:hypothetical protein
MAKLPKFQSADLYEVIQNLSTAHEKLWKFLDEVKTYASPRYDRAKMVLGEFDRFLLIEIASLERNVDSVDSKIRELESRDLRKEIDGIKKGVAKRV